MKHPFLTGAAVYPLIEIAWRGRTHPAMALAGGLAMQGLSIIQRTQTGRPLWQRALLGGLMITGIEYAIGRTMNRRYQIWDYRRTPLNLHGQICLPKDLIEDSSKSIEPTAFNFGSFFNFLLTTKCPTAFKLGISVILLSSYKVIFWLTTSGKIVN